MASGYSQEKPSVRKTHARICEGGAGCPEPLLDKPHSQIVWARIDVRGQLTNTVVAFADNVMWSGGQAYSQRMWSGEQPCLRFRPRRFVVCYTYRTIIAGKCRLDSEKTRSERRTLQKVAILPVAKTSTTNTSRQSRHQIPADLWFRAH